MKRLSYIFASLLLLAGCNERLDVAQGLQVPDGEMPVDLALDGPMAGPGTRSYVNGTETAISTIKMLCFDTEGSYITARDGQVTATDATHGSLKGTVPANTARVHFLANFAGLDLSSFGVGSMERSMMKSVQLSSGITDDVRFWGYHKEDSNTAMAVYLKSRSTLVLLRDRAKVTVINQDADISAIQWTISNGLNRGFVAAASSSDNSHPYDNSYVNGTILSEYRSSGTYTLSDTESIWTGPGTANPQFLFENANSTDPVKIIVKATYGTGTSAKVRYHTILLQDADKRQYRIFRNQSFVLTIKDLPSKDQSDAVGSDTFAEAVSTTNYSNNPFAQVAREVNEINNEQFRLTVERTAKFYYSGTTGSVEFTYTGHDGGDVSGLSGSDFDVSWEPKSDTDERPDVSPVTTAPTVTYNSGTGKGLITFPLNTINSTLKFGTLQVVAPSGLTRYVNIYSISAFSFATVPALTDNETKRPVDGIDRETYKLTFALPDDLPPDRYPVTVRMYSNTLVPFSDAGPTAPHGSFDITVGYITTLDATDQSNQWNYNANKWDSWYEFVINKPSADNSYTVYLNEFVAELFPEQVMSTVGLYFEIEGFGGRRPLSLAAPQPTRHEVTFPASGISISNHTGQGSSQGITVVFANSAKSGNDIELGYNSGYNGNTRHNGTITVSTNSESHPVVEIELTYVSGYLGGTVTPSTGSFTKGTTTGTWTGNTSSDVRLTMGRTTSNAYARISSIKVTYLGY